MKNRNMWMGVGLMALALTAMFMGTAGADIVTATFTADNYYGLFTQVGNGVLKYEGRNETGAVGTPGTYNWSLPETYNVSPVSFTLYVIAWDDETVARGVQGSVAFNFTNPSATDSTFYTQVGGAWSYPNVKSYGWEGYDTGIDNGGNGFLGTYVEDEANMTTAVQNAVTADIWKAVQLATYASWGNPVPGATQANWIWYGNNGKGTNYSDTVKVFRCKFEITPNSGIADVPEPATLSLLGLGLAGLAVRRMRRKN